MSLKRNGEMFAQLRITFESHDASEEDRRPYCTALAETLRRCSQLPFTDGLGGAIAGRPITFRFIDGRQPHKAGFRAGRKFFWDHLPQPGTNDVSRRYCQW